MGQHCWVSGKDSSTATPIRECFSRSVTIVGKMPRSLRGPACRVPVWIKCSRISRAIWDNSVENSAFEWHSLQNREIFKSQSTPLSVAKYVCGDLRAHFSNLFPYLANRIVCFHITFDRPVFLTHPPLLLVNNNVTCIRGAAGDVRDVSPLLFPEQRARLINGSVLLSVWRFAYFPLAQRAPHQLISTWQPQKSRSLGKCHF